jgi:hypothetical protein
VPHRPGLQCDSQALPSDPGRTWGQAGLGRGSPAAPDSALVTVEPAEASVGGWGWDLGQTECGSGPHG